MAKIGAERLRPEAIPIDNTHTRIAHDPSHDTKLDFFISDYKNNVRLWTGQEARDRETAQQVELVQRARETKVDANLEVEREHLELEKKLKLPAIQENVPVPDHFSLIPAAFVIDKLRKLEYIPMWYFTSAGLKSSRSSSSLTVSSSCSDTGEITLIVSDAHAKPDVKLTWDELLEAKFVYLRSLSEAGWDTVHICKWEELYHLLESNDLRLTSSGKKTLVLYYVQVREAFFRALARKDATIFDVACYSKSLMDNCKHEIFMQETDELSLPHFTNSSRGTVRRSSPSADGKRHRKQRRLESHPFSQGK